MDTDYTIALAEKLFGLTVPYDRKALQTAYKELMKKVHPDNALTGDAKAALDANIAFEALKRRVEASPSKVVTPLYHITFPDSENRVGAKASSIIVASENEKEPMRGGVERKEPAPSKSVRKEAEFRVPKAVRRLVEVFPFRILPVVIVVIISMIVYGDAFGFALGYRNKPYEWGNILLILAFTYGLFELVGGFTSRHIKGAIKSGFDAMDAAWKR